MAPELWEGLRFDPRSDLYAWGLVLCECLTGERLVQGSQVSMMREHLDREGRLEEGLPALQTGNAPQCAEGHGSNPYSVAEQNFTRPERGS